MDEELKHSLDELSKTNRALLRSQSYWRTFGHGVISAIGATVGATIILALVVWLLNSLTGFSFLRPTVEKVLPYVDKATKSKTSQESLPAAQYVTSPSPTSESSPTQ